jgi:acylpyruvate hydrolase
MKLARAVIDGGPLVIVRGEQDAIAQVAGQSFADLPDLLIACAGDATRISAGRSVTLRDEALLSPLDRPRKIICIGLNYHAHAAEAKQQLPAQPIIFPKWDNAITGPFADIPLPPESHQVDWEAEFAFVFGKRCRRVKAADAGSVVFGYTAANDVSMRDFQFHTSQWGPGKDWDRATPLGPVVVTLDELGPSPDLSIRGRLNGQQMQDSRTSDLIFGVGALVEYMTTVMTMEPGDVVLTGTPSGVGSARKFFLKDGDVYEVEIEGIGTLRNRFVTER